MLGQAFHFPTGRLIERQPALGLEAVASVADGGDWRVTVTTRRFAYAVSFDAPGFLPDDDFFHMAPGGATTVTLRRLADRQPPAVRLQAVNAAVATKVKPPA